MASPSFVRWERIELNCLHLPEHIFSMGTIRWRVGLLSEKVTQSTGGVVVVAVVVHFFRTIEGMKCRWVPTNTTPPTVAIICKHVFAHSCHRSRVKPFSRVRQCSCRLCVCLAWFSLDTWLMLCSTYIGNEVFKVEVHPRADFKLEAVDNSLSDINYFKYEVIDDKNVAIKLAHSLEDLVDRVSFGRGRP